MSIISHNPDVLNCIANLSNDEVFTPPDTVNAILDRVAEAWAQSNEGEDIWSNPEVTFLDPCTKSGVFLREVTRRLCDGLALEIPNLQERVDHILTQQVFGVAITNLTAMLTRRSVYCSKWANGDRSVCTQFENEQGNIYFEPSSHSWDRGKRESVTDPVTGEAKIEYYDKKCIFCGVPEEQYNRSEDLESHAYAFIHTDCPQSLLHQFFGEGMKFDVVIGNPPYQLGSKGTNRDRPIYQHFVSQAKKLDPKLLVMIIPSRWMTTGLGLKDFRAEMLQDRRIRELFDFPNSQDVFQGVEVKGGVCYFLWDSDYEGKCNYTSVRGEVATRPWARYLDEYDVLVRGEKDAQILRKVLAFDEPSVKEILSVDKQFGWTSNYKGLTETAHDGSVPVYCVQEKKRQIKYTDRSNVRKSPELLKFWKVLVPEAASDGGKTLPDLVLGKPWLAEPGSACTQSFLFFMFDSEDEAQSFETYYRTRLFRFLVSLRKTTQHAPRATYSWVPVQPWDREWTDEMLYEKYGINDDEIKHIESMVRPMEME